ncbi:FCD domain-containing protein [Rhodococcus sp. WB9]|uniref:FCD domain-containing protein n=1 Tax=Rhodococcus sp. WB9 TaxID=2594007 RepID=UPI0021B46EDA|nr:FCD domain-containing protein [Rhodococcus sp. WB9]
MRAAIAERRVVALLDHDEALLTILYEAAANSVLIDSIRTLWQHCRAYKLVGAQGTWTPRETLVVEVPGTSRRGRPQG